MLVLVSAGVCVRVGKNVLCNSFLPNTHHQHQQTYFPYLHNHEYFALDRVLLVSVGVCARAHTHRHTNTEHQHTEIRAANAISK